MWDVVLSLVFLFFIFLFIGLGPTCFFFKHTISFEKFVIFSPVLGYIFTMMIGVYLTLLDFPVNSWVHIYLFLAIIISVILFRYNYQEIKIFNIDIIGLYVLVFLILIIPMLVGGIQYTIFRGNGTDSFNYMSMAGFLQYEHWSLLEKASFNDLLNKHASYPLAKVLLTERWATSLVLAYFSSLVKIPIYRLEYAYNLLFFWMSSGLFYLFAKGIVKKKIYIDFFIAIICSTGFWAQLILDTRAMSQMSVLPVILLFFYLFVDLRKNYFSILLLMGILGSSIVFLYVEILPILILSLGLYVLFECSLQNDWKTVFKSLGIILIVSILFLLPSFNFLLLFFEKQFHLAMENKITWHLAYFSWLYDFPLSGFWGLGPFCVFNFIIRCLFIFSFLMSIVFFYGLNIFFLKNKNRYMVLSSCVSWVGLIIFIFLYYKKQYWAAGKILSYVYPFFIFSFLGSMELISRASFKIILNVILYIWISSQLILAFLRIPLAITHKEFSHYILGHGYYRKHDYEDQPFQNLNCQIIKIDLNDGWLEEYFNLVFGWRYKIINMHGVHDRQNHVIGYQNNLDSYDCYFRKIRPASINEKILANNTEFELIKMEFKNE